MKLSICMMVKDEEKYLSTCLNSIQGILKKVNSELIIVDTGSKDKTIEIAKSFTNKVYFHKWENNFSEMRNVTIKYAKGEWILILDADEELIDEGDLVNFIKSNESNKYNTATFIEENVMSKINDDYMKSSFTTLRLFRNDGSFKYTGAVHNTPIYKYPIKNLTAKLLHYGYIKEDKELGEKKFKRTSEILKSEIEKGPDNIYYLFQLAVTYQSHEENKTALEYAIKAYNLLTSKNENREKHIYLYFRLASLYYINGFYNEAKNICNEGLKLENEHIDLYYLSGKADFQLNNFSDAIVNFKKYFSLINNFDKLSIKNSTSIELFTIAMQDEAMYNLALCYYFSANYSECQRVLEKFKSKIFEKEIIGLTIKLYIKINAYEKLSKFYYEKKKNYQDYFLENSIEELYNEVEKNEWIKIYKALSKGETEYSILNKFRLNIINNTNIDNELNYIDKIDFINLPDYFGDLIYYFIKNKIDIYNYIFRIKEKNLINFLVYISNKYDDILITLFKYVTNFSIDDFKYIKINKIISKYILSIDIINDYQYENAFNKYLKNGIKYMDIMYSKYILENELVNEVKNEEEAFLLYMFLAAKVKEYDKAKYIDYLRSALRCFPYFNKGIEILINSEDKKQNHVNDQLQQYKIQVKNTIKDLIENNKLDEALDLIEEYIKIDSMDIEIYSMKAVIYMMQGNLNEAELVLKHGITIDSENFDLNYNLGYLYEQGENFNKAVRYYKKALDNCIDEVLKTDILSIIEKISTEHDIKLKDKKKIAFFVKQGLDSFLGDIINGLSNEYEIKKIIVTEFKQIDEGMEWADICWFEWCDELVIYGSKIKLDKNKKLICRLHSYEAFTDYPSNVNWESINKVIFISENLRTFVIDKFKLQKEKTIVIPNGIDLSKYTFKERNPGFNIAYVGYINYKKGPMLLLHAFKAIYDYDKRFKLYIAGEFQDYRDILYFRQMIKELGIENNIIYEGWQNDLNKWLEDKNYILCTSILESQNMSVMQAMAKGIKPVVHNFVGAKDIYDKEYVWNTIDEAVDMIIDNNYNSKEYRNYIEEKYSLEKQIDKIKKLIKMDEAPIKEEITLDYIYNKFNEFIGYKIHDYNNYDFNSAEIVIGKKEKINDAYDMIEFIINNKEDNRLIINNIWYDKINSNIILPEQMKKCDKMTYLLDFVNRIVKLNVNYTNNIAGFIFDKNINEDVNKNSLIYSWERAIPASQFMPMLGYLKIAERYIFAGKYIKKKDKVLESPCGFGYGAAYFSKICSHVEALDIAEDNIKFGIAAYGFNNIKWKIGDVTNLPYKNNEFDVYVSYEVFEHLPLDLIEKYLIESNRVIKESGKFIISTPNIEMRKHINNPFHIKEYSFQEFKNLLEKHFRKIEYFSVSDYKVDIGMKNTAFSMIAVCEK